MSALWCVVLQCDAVCCGVLRRVAASSDDAVEMVHCTASSTIQVAVCCGVLQGVAVHTYIDAYIY